MINSLRQLYVGERNKRASEADFLHALELMQIAYEVSIWFFGMYCAHLFTIVKELGLYYCAGSPVLCVNIVGQK